MMSAVTGDRRKTSSPTAAAIAFMTAPKPAPTPAMAAEARTRSRLRGTMVLVSADNARIVPANSHDVEFCGHAFTEAAI